MHGDDIVYFGARSNFLSLSPTLAFLLSLSHQDFTSVSVILFFSACLALFHVLSSFDIKVSVFVNCELWIESGLVQLISVFVCVCV